MFSKKWPTCGAMLLFVPCCSEKERVEAVKLALDYAKHLLSKDCPRSIALMESKSHPDFKHIEPEKESRWIRIDQLREIIDWSYTKPQIASKKITLLSPAEAINLQAANAFLKILEEYGQDSLFILVAHQLNTLPATLLSRCHIIRHRISWEETCKEGDPLKGEVLQGLDLLDKAHENPVLLAARWSKKEISEVVYCLSQIICEKIRRFLNLGQVEHAQFGFLYLDIIFAAQKTLMESSSANKELLMEHLLIHYVSVFKNHKEVSLCL